MKRYNVRELKGAILESNATRHNILTLLESSLPESKYVEGRWKGYRITLPDGVQLATKLGIRMAGEGHKVKVFNKDGQYTAYSNQNGIDYPIELTYVLNESNGKVTDLIVFD